MKVVKMSVIRTICYLTLITITTALPIKNQIIEAPDLIEPEIIKVANLNITETAKESNDTLPEIREQNILKTSDTGTRNQVRPGMSVSNYDVEITVNDNGDTFNGRLLAQVIVEDASTREDDIILQVEGLTIDSVQFSMAGGSNFQNADFDVDDGQLEISTGIEATLYNFRIEYRGSLSTIGRGLYVGSYINDGTYLAMNLHPTNARRVFPCIDEPNQSSTIRFTFNNIEYDNLVVNSMLEDNSQTQFRPLQGPPHLWGMVAHNLNNAYFPTPNVVLNGRAQVLNQEAQASIAINHYFHALNEWTNKPYLEILLNQNGRMNVIALPDTDRDWYALSTVCIWEPYVFMEINHSVKQRQLALTKIAESMARQWFGYVIHPENWRFQWVTSGLATYAGYEMLKDFQDGPLDTDNALLDVNTLFVTEVIQESLLRDAYTNTQALESDEDIFDEEDIRHNVNGLLKYKAPAIMRMLRLVLGGAEDDFIQLAARALLNSRSLQTVNSLNFYDAINSEWLFGGAEVIDDISDFLEAWVQTTGYPTIHVGLRQGGVLITQERFAFSPVAQRNYEIPITYTTNENPNFDDDNIHPVSVIDGTTTLDLDIDEDEGWIIFNIQAQGYYRVNYDPDLWDNLIDALEDPERREEIHPLNRAALLDDALNLARASKIDYEIALRIALTMEHETEYAVWKAFVRNMNFLRKRLTAMVEEDDDLDQDIYLRMVRRAIVAFEEEIGFEPERATEPAMVSLTRGLVMDHACRSNYDHCIGVAIDMFYDPNNNEVVNPDIPRDLRPAVYCTMMREGDEDARSALYERMEIEPSYYERIVILESLACSQDAGFIRTLLEETIANNSPYSAEESVRIFKAVAESSYQNARLALNFIILRTNEIRNRYGGADKLEEVILTLADNMANEDLSIDFINWIGSRNNNLDDSEDFAESVATHVDENVNWENAQLEYVYEWIDENDASTLFVSAILITLSLVITLFNN
ncbi:PREDICTED: membrane alanyl aminopeptidase-like isoform X2 [Papilio polytes]|uniref:membrane alanyl aminopeptidase-like isoform X2 n=1 Tax=Papilio polytes TaxID=76194 RepID=UPI0006765497|nr:PREDICTED: membrane alanyl aminopeptidase-like isoform X2 [Papilio polytes]